MGTEAGAPIDLHLVKICKILCSSSWGLLGEGGWGKSQAMEGAVGLGAMCPWGVAGEGCLQVYGVDWTIWGFAGRGLNQLVVD